MLVWTAYRKRIGRADGGVGNEEFNSTNLGKSNIPTNTIGLSTYCHLHL